MHLQKALVTNTPLIHSLATSIWWKHYPAIIGEEQVKYMLGKMYSLEALEHQIKTGAQQFFLLMEDDLPLGFISYEEKHNDEGFIHKFYILDNKQRKGCGTAAFNLLLAEFPDADTIRLQVNRQNYQAINFYFKVGFSIEEVADFNIGDGYFMNDFILQWQRK
jgi:ribosomal protein S18 acetylase RimI-like enzyme